MKCDSNLEGMWSAEVSRRSIPRSINMDFIYLTSRKNPGVCGGVYLSQYIGNKHPSLTFTVHVHVKARYFGTIICEDVAILIVKPGKAHEIELGCTGFQNNSGGYNTTYEREPIAVYPL